ncbi:hypothetical protein Hanom_Chr03g00256001 [Helianthus anomalus]
MRGEHTKTDNRKNENNRNRLNRSVTVKIWPKPNHLVTVFPSSITETEPIVINLCVFHVYPCI